MLGRHAHHRGTQAGVVQPRRISRFMEPALLLLLHRQAYHGYGLIERLDKLGMETYPADASALYRILYDLEGAGMVTSTRETEQTAGPPRRVYKLTRNGETYLSAWAQELEETDRLLHRFLDAYYEHMDSDAAAEHGSDPVPRDKDETP